MRTRERTRHHDQQLAHRHECRDGLEGLARVRRYQIVQRARAVRRHLVVFVETVVEHLVLEAERRVVRGASHGDFLGHVVFHAAVAGATDLPLPGQLEVTKGVAGHQIATRGGLSVRESRHLAVGDFPDRAVFDLPVRGGHAVVAESTPAVERAPIEQ